MDENDWRPIHFYVIDTHLNMVRDTIVSVVNLLPRKVSVTVRAEVMGFSA